MNHVTLIALAAGAGFALAPQAFAQSGRHAPEPRVIAGPTPEEIATGAAPVYAPAPRAHVQPAPQGAAGQGYGRYGGGFIEFLATGQSSAATGRPSAVYSAAPQESLPAPQMHGRVYAPLPAPIYAAPPQAQTGASFAPQPRIRSASLAPDPAPRAARGVDPQFQRQEVAYDGPHGPGTIVIDTPKRLLYLVQSNGRALRYGIGVGRPGFEWSGVKSVTRKAEWPDWRPPPEMRKRRPDLPTFMKGGPENPLGARALYLGSSLYRIHGTNEPHTIGRNVSSGCIRMMNDDVVDLYQRVPVGAKVIVI